MPNWPEESPEKACDNNEGYKTGRYPISENNHWHSGIHISSINGTESPEVYPFIGGELAAYRISREFKTVPRRKVVFSSEYAKFSNEERKLYVPLNSDLYELKADISEEERNEKHCNNYILLKHYFYVKKQGSETYELINFFILYTNIAPALPGQTGGTYHLSTAPKKIPFYYKHRFFVYKYLDYSYKYTTISINQGNIKLFPLSHCTFWEKDSTTYYCNFVNFDDPDKIIEVPKGDIEELDKNQGGKSWYVPKELGVPIYNLNMPKNIKDDPDNYTNDMQNHFIVGLKTSAYFSKNNALQEGKFLRVNVDIKEVTESGKITVDGTKVLVKETDLILKTKGRLKNNNSFCRYTMKGLMVYDEEKGNARDILVAETEFELSRPDDVLKHIPYNESAYFLLKTKKYILYEKPYQDKNDPVEVKVDWDDSYKNNEAVTSPKTAIYDDMLLGYGYQPSFYKNDYYDAALFFKDIDFMDKECEAVERYFIPPSITLYKLKNKDITKPDFDKEQFDLPQILKTTRESVKISLSANYIEFFLNNEYYYLPEYEARVYKVNMLDWKKFFRVLDGKVEKIEDAADGLKFIKENFKWSTDSKNVGALLGESNPNWWSEDTESKKTKLIKRSIICGHPLELDKEQYIENGSIKRNIQKSYGLNMATKENTEYFKNMVKAIDVWGELKVSLKEILGADKNNFWFAHPVYFINHLDKAGLLNIYAEDLKKVQDKIIALNCLKKGARGMYDQDPPSQNQTYCNHAVFLTIKAVDKNFRNFTQRKDDAFPEAPSDYTDNTGLKKSNYWCDILKKQAELGILVKLNEGNDYKLGEQRAQEYANRGYVVIAAWKNLNSVNEINNSPHYATARPGYVYNPKEGTMLANVGNDNGLKNVIEGFGKGIRSEIKWYYNPNQIFQNEIDSVLKFYKLS
jgi:hypothetical protein